MDVDRHNQLETSVADRLEADVTHLEQRVAADIAAAQEQKDPDRWRRCHVRQSPLAGDIVARVWGTSRPLMWQILAVALVSQRLEDDQPTPRTSADPVRGELEALIDAEWSSRLPTPNGPTLT